MNILAVSYSNVVLELLKIVFKEDGVDGEYIKSIDDAKDDSYSIIFIDDSAANSREKLEDIIDNFSYSKLIYLGKISSEYEDLADLVVRKPFLPQHIKEIVDIEIEDNPRRSETKVLDVEEINRIKELMSLDDIENDKKDYLKLLENKESFKVKRKEAKEFLYRCSNLSQKELKKLLKGAKVSIKVEFKREDNE